MKNIFGTIINFNVNESINYLSMNIFIRYQINFSHFSNIFMVIKQRYHSYKKCISRNIKKSIDKISIENVIHRI